MDLIATQKPGRTSPVARRRPAVSAAILVLAAAMILATAPQPALAQAEDASVEAGRESLDQWGRYPWYDSQQDGLKPIKINLPWNWTLDWRFPALPDMLYVLVKIFFWVLTALLVLLVVYWMYRTFVNRNRSQQGDTARVDVDAIENQRRFEALPETVRRPRTGLLDEARRNYLEGNFTEAAIYLFSHQLVQLDRHHLIRLAKGKTNRQYLRELTGRSALGRIFVQTLVTFEDVFFGNHPIDRRRFESCWTRLDEFEILAAKETI